MSRREQIKLTGEYHTDCNLILAKVEKMKTALEKIVKLEDDPNHTEDDYAYTLSTAIQLARDALKD